jgi:hypothetical protein
LFFPEGDESDPDWVPARPEDIAVIAGELDVTAPRPELLRAVAAMAAHPGYIQDGGVWDADGLGADNDIGVVVLEAPVDVLEPVALLPVDRVDVELEAGDELSISGYGLTDVVDPGWDVFLSIAVTHYRRRNDLELLTGMPGDPSTCYGDSGGPVYLLEPGRPRLVGVTSRGNPSTMEECVVGNISTLAPAYVDWIVEASGGEYQPATDADADSDADADADSDVDADADSDADDHPDADADHGADADQDGRLGVFGAAGGSGCVASGAAPSGALGGVRLLAP